MNIHILTNMIDMMVRAGVVDEADRDKAIKVMLNYWEYKVADIWSVDDILDRANQSDIYLTMVSAINILDSIKNNMDANSGINWEVLDVHIDTYKEELPKGCSDIWKEEDVDEII